jgi:hypothetical protein
MHPDPDAFLCQKNGRQKIRHGASGNGHKKAHSQWQNQGHCEYHANRCQVRGTEKLKFVARRHALSIPFEPPFSRLSAGIMD